MECAPVFARTERMLTPTQTSTLFDSTAEVALSYVITS